MRYLSKFIKTFLTSLQEPNGKGSGKRFVLYIVAGLISFATIKYTNENNLVPVVGELSLLVVALAGVSAHYKNRDKEPINQPKDGEL